MILELRVRASLLAALLSVPAMLHAAATDYDGQWAATLGCSAHASNGRPAFTNRIVFTVAGGRIAHNQSQVTAAGQEETRWEGRIDDGRLVLGATARREPDARWSWDLSGKAAGNDRIAGSGAIASDGRKVRDCTIEMRLDAPAPASLAARAQQPQGASVQAAQAPPAQAKPAPPVQPAVVPQRSPEPAQAVPPQPTPAQPAQAAAVQPPQPTPTGAASAANRALQAAQAAMPALANASRGVGVQVPGTVAGTSPALPGSTPALAAGPAAATPTVASTAPAAAGANPEAASARAGLSPVEQRLETIAGNRNLDLLLLVSNREMRGTLRRSVSGEWSLQGDALCIDIGELVKADGIQIPWSAFSELGARPVSGDMRIQSYYQALRFTPARQYGLREPPRPGFSGPTPTVSAGIPSRSAAPRPESDSADYWATLATAFEIALQKRFGRPVRVSVNLGGTGCSPDAYAIPRMLVDATMGPKLSSRWKANLDAGQLHEIATVPIGDYRVARDIRQQGFAQAAKAADGLLRRLADSPATGAGALYGALGVGGSSIRACYATPDAAGTPRHGVSLEAVLRSDAFARFQSGKTSSIRKFDSVDALYADLQKRDGRCTIILGNGPTLATLKAAIDRDRQLDGRLMPDPLDEAVLLQVHAAALGFKDSSAYLFGNSIGVRDAAQVARLQELGIASAEQFAAARKRLEQVEPGARDSIDALIQLAADEREASAKGTSVKAIRTERARREEAEARRHAAAMAAGEKAKAAEFPFVAVFSCSIGQQKTSLQACMSSGSVDTEIELKNGNDYRMYKIHDVASIGRWTGDEMVVDLRRSFEIKAQNADRTLVMNLVVKDRASGRTLYQRSAAQFGVMRVAN
ncbi:MAG: hypothetical protein LXA50_22685 [Betaproteobacteria bacterium]|nr:hypothetical protein [Betaproteobacteria bacterium]